jgi:hypothetical protein
MVIGTRLKAHLVHKHSVPVVSLLAMVITAVLSASAAVVVVGGGGRSWCCIAHVVQLAWSRSGCWT